MIPERDVFVHFIDHLGNKEAVTQNEDGTFSVFIDPALSHEEQQKQYKHALEHINGLHFEKQNIQEIESEAHHIEYQTVPVKPTMTKKYHSRRSTAKQWNEVNNRIDFIMDHIANGDPDYFFHKAVDNWLYGGL